MEIVANTIRGRLFGIAAIVGAIGFVVYAGAGPLVPPDGPITPTQKPLQQIEPRTPIGSDTTPGDDTALYVIDRPGSYYLTRDVVAGPQRDAIRIEASNVTIDGRGFAIRFEEPTFLNRAIVSPEPSDFSSIVLRNLHTDGAGIRLASISGVVAEDIVVTGAVSATSGIGVGESSVLRNCAVINGGIGAGGGATISDCTVTGSGFSISAGGIITRCSAINGGFFAFADATFRHCSAFNNAGAGFLALTGSAVFDRCSAFENQSYGFVFLPESTGQVIGCTTSGNAIAEIRVHSGVRVCDNTCRTSPGGVGIEVVGRDNRVEGNHVSGGADPAFLIEGDTNFFARNTSLGNASDFVFTGVGNLVGPTPVFRPEGDNIKLEDIDPTTNFAR